MVDPTKPNISRIYDYVLGGHHNLEVDRMAAQQILKVFPSYPRWARLNRWFLQLVAERWAAEGHANVIDLGSGMPTQGHFHMAMPNSKVIYTDNDPVTVAYAREVLGDSTTVMYLHVNVGEPETILEAARQHFGDDRVMAIGCIGIAYFLNDEDLAKLMRALYNWAAPGSVMAFSQVYAKPQTENNREAEAAFKRSGAEIFSRDEDHIRRIVGPWEIREFKPLAAWLQVENLMEESDREGANAEMYGAILKHAG